MMTTLTAPAFAFLFTGILLNAGAQLLLKAGTNALGVITLTRDNWFSMLWRMAHTGPFIAGVACYGVSLLVWIMGLSRVPVSIAYPLLSLAYIINAIAAYFLFGEAMTVMRWLGLGLIIAGVFLIARPA
jgi:multidrug transporter EmrE-like cation transporter